MKDIKGYESLYAVTRCGKVWSYKSKRFLKTTKNQYEYETVGLMKNGKRKYKYVHRIVAETYLNNRENGTEVNHKDENKSNNSVDNLEWITHKENVNYGSRVKRIAQRKSKKVKCLETGQVFNSMREAEEAYGIKNISRCCSGKRKSVGGYHWETV